MLVGDHRILAYLLEDKCNFQVQEDELLQIMQICVVAEFYKGLMSVLKLPQIKTFFVHASLKFKV